MVWSDPALTVFIAHLGIVGAIHPINNLIRGEPRRWISGAPEFAIDDIANAFEDTAHQPFRQDRIGASLGGLVLFVSHESKYEYRSVRVRSSINAELVRFILAEKA